MSSDKENREVISGTAWSLLSRIIQVVVKSGAVIFLARFLGANEFGLFMLVISISTIATAFIDIGISPGTARLLAENRYNNKELIRKSILLLSLTSIGVLAICYIGFPWLSDLLSARELSDVNQLVIVLIFSLIVQKYLMKVFEGSRQVISFGKIYSLAGWLPWFLSFFFVLVQGENVVWAVTGYTIGFLVLDVMLAINFAKYYIGQKEEGESVNYKKIFRYALPMIATTASLYIYTQSDILLIQYFLGAEAVGIYGSAIKLIEASMVGAMAIGNGSSAYFPLMKSKGAAAFKRIIVYTTKTIKLLYLPVAGAIILSSYGIINLLYGVEYINAHVILLIYVPYIICRALSCVYSPGLDYLGLADQRAMAVGVSALLNVVLNIILIPRFGIEGAAVATQLTYTPLILAYLIYMFKSVDIGFKGYFNIFWKIYLVWLALLTLAGAVSYYTTIHSIVLAVVFGVLFFLFNFFLKEINFKALKTSLRRE